MRTAVPTPAAQAAALPEVLSALTSAADRSAVDLLVVVDGLGARQLRAHRGHASFLRSLEDRTRTIPTVAPTTTAAALTSLGTGHPPGVHGLVGAANWDPVAGGVVNNLDFGPSGTPPVEPERYQPHATLFERSSRPAIQVGPHHFAGSGLTRAGFRGAAFVGHGPGERPQVVGRVLRRAEPGTVVYVHISEVDSAGHRDGVGSDSWLAALEQADAELRGFHAALPRGATLTVTADHGMITTDPARARDLSAEPDLADRYRVLGGEPRLLQVHLREGLEPQRERDRFADVLGAAARVRLREEVLADGVLGPADRIEERVRGRLGDLMVEATGNGVLVDPRFHSPGFRAMRGVHGGLTAAERQIPLATVEA